MELNSALLDGGLFAEDGSVLCRAGRYFGRTARPIANRRSRDAPTPLTLPLYVSQVKLRPAAERAKGGREERRERERERERGERSTSRRAVFVTTPPRPFFASRVRAGREALRRCDSRRQLTQKAEYSSRYGHFKKIIMLNSHLVTIIISFEARNTPLIGR